MSALGEHMAGGAATVCRAWIVRRVDGFVLGFTDHDVDLRVEEVTCHAASGLTAGALQAGTGLAVDNGEATGALRHDAIRAEDLRAGLWDGAEVTSYLLNWADTSVREIVFRGSLGEIAWGGGTFSAELRGLSEALNQTRGRVYQKRCDAVLGDQRCGVDLGPAYAVEVEVLGVEDGQTLLVPVLETYEQKWFESGRLIVLTGAAAGTDGRIKTDRARAATRDIGLWQSLRRSVVAGDRVRLEAGCDKRMSTCQGKFRNVLNFRGFPHIPGEDWLLAYPTSDGRNDGGRL